MTDDEVLQQKRRGYWLRRARLKAGFTLAAASELAGLSAGSGSTVSRWEEGTREIKVTSRTIGSVTWVCIAAILERRRRRSSEDRSSGRSCAR